MNRKQYHNYFERRERVINKGSVDEKIQPFYCCKEEAPQDLSDLIYNIHKEHFFGCFPCDWIYDTMHSAFLDLADNELDDCSIEADSYTYELWKWLGNSYASEFIAEAIEEGLISEKESNIYNIISGGQWLAKKRIYEVVDEFMQGEEQE